MDRRDFLATAAIGVVTLPVTAQTVTIGGETQAGYMYVVPGAPPSDPAERKRQYAICKERGHVAGPANTYMNAVPAIYPPPVPWDKCKFCGTSFRTVVTRTDEESNAPE